MTEDDSLLFALLLIINQLTFIFIFFSFFLSSAHFSVFDNGGTELIYLSVNAVILYVTKVMFC